MPQRVLKMIEKLIGHFDPLYELGTEDMHLAAARQSLGESHDLARLTWLATMLVPLTFISGLYSMNENIGLMPDTFKMYFATPLPLAVFAAAMTRRGSLNKPYFKVPNILKSPDWCVEWNMWAVNILRQLLWHYQRRERTSVDTIDQYPLARLR